MSANKKPETPAAPPTPAPEATKEPKTPRVRLLGDGVEFVGIGWAPVDGGWRVGKVVIRDGRLVTVEPLGEAEFKAAAQERLKLAVVRELFSMERE
jgi:hypothetical protein